MAVQARMFSKVLAKQRSSSTLTTLSRRFYEKEGETGTPYRPAPFNAFFYPQSQQYWNKDYPQQSEKADEYEGEEVYLDEIEARMRKYDRKYAQSDKVKKLYNEFGNEEWDDRAFMNYGGGLSGENDELQYGRGKKIDPDNYVNPDFAYVTRKAIAPIEYLTPEQIRRSRGSLGGMRELPPETPSIFKLWNGYSVGFAFGALCIAKEFFILGGHDMWDAVLYWCIFGVAGSVIGDGLAWMNAVLSQEVFDREYFAMTEKVKELNEQIEALASKPDERVLLLNLIAYRDSLAEKVLQRTLSNRVSRLVDAANKKLSDKLGEEAQIRKDAESGWQKEALDKTLTYFDDAKVKQQFMQDAVKQFCAPGAASLKTSATPATSPAVDTFKSKYSELFESAKTNYIKENTSKGTLSMVFVDAKERARLRMSKQDKETEFTKRIKSWEQSHNPVNAQLPAFA